SAPKTTAHVTVTPTAHASTSASLTTSATRSTTARPAAAFPTAPPAALDDGSTATDSSSPSASATQTQDDNGPAVPVAVIHGRGSVSLIPAAVLAAALIVFAGVFGAAARYIYLHGRPPEN
ncbi:MAG TPA: hypothetical protein VKQ07_10510, partial [Jatrophihabitantaceae bacterium]|nr:hypothetical protein [Jatrophihabitantaceae bacterium]